MGEPRFPLHGSCLCGAVSVTVNTPPLLTLACHCGDCQKLTASTFSLSIMFAETGVEIAGPLEKGGLHTQGRDHYFCTTCKTFVYSQIMGSGRINLRASVLEDLSWFSPFVELMTQDKQPWATVPAQRSFETFPQSVDELKQLMADYAVATSQPD